MSRRRRRIGLGGAGGAANDPGNAFIFSVKTDNVGASEDDEFTIPAVIGGIYRCRVNFGDGTPTVLITTYDDARWTHVFAGGAGTYTITITGTFTGWNDVEAGFADKLKMLEVTSWGLFAVGAGEVSFSLFNGAANFTVAAGAGSFNTVGATNASFWFTECTSLTYLDGTGWDTALFEAWESTFDTTPLLATLLGPELWDMSSTAIIVAMFADTILDDVRMDLWNAEAMVEAEDFYTGAALTQARMDATFIAWEAQDVNNDVEISFGTSTYSVGAATTAHDALVSDHSWVIVSGGQL